MQNLTAIRHRASAAVDNAPEGELPLHALLLVVALAAAVTRQGAYYATGQRVLGVLLVAAVFLAWRASAPERGDMRLAPVVACAALAAWSVVSAAVAGDLGGAVAPVALLSAVAAVLFVCRRTTPAQRDGLAAGLVAVGALCALSGWIGVAWRVTPWALQDQGLWRAATTLTYANATAGLLVPLALVAASRAVSRPDSLMDRLALCGLFVGAAATLSRGGMFALVAGGIVLALLTGPKRLIRAAGPAALGALVALAGLVPSMPASSPPRPLLAGAGLLAGLVVTAALGDRRWRVPAAVSLVLGLALVATVFGGVVADGVREITGPRLTVDSPDRAKETEAAVRLVGDHPLTGTGPGRAELIWTAPDGARFFARWAHNEYLQVAAELGIPGLVFLGAVIVAVAVTVRRGSTFTPSPELWAGVVAALVALGLHSALDFLWHVSAIPLMGAVLVGLAVPPVATSMQLPTKEEGHT